MNLNIDKILIYFLIGIGIILLPILFLIPIKTNAQVNQGGVYSTNPGVINAFTSETRQSSNAISQVIVRNSVYGSNMFRDSNGEILINSITLYVENMSGSGQAYSLGYTASIGSGGLCTVETIPGNYIGFFTWNDCSFPSGTSFGILDRFEIRIQKSSSPFDVRLWGYSSSHWLGGECISSGVTDCLDVEDLYFAIDFESFGGFDFETFMIPTDLETTRILNINNPINGSTIATTTVNLNFDIISAQPIADQLCFYYNTNTQNFNPECFTVTQSGLINFQREIELPFGTNWFFLRLLDENENIIDSKFGSYHIIENTSQSLPPTDIDGCDNPDGILETFGCTIRKAINDVITWLFIPTISFQERIQGTLNLLSNKSPFGYFFSIRNSLQGMSEEDGNLGNITVNLGENSIGSITMIDWEGAGELFNNLGFNEENTRKLIAGILWFIFVFWIVSQITYLLR